MICLPAGGTIFTIPAASPACLRLPMYCRTFLNSSTVGWKTGASGTVLMIRFWSIRDFRSACRCYCICLCTCRSLHLKQRTLDITGQDFQNDLQPFQLSSAFKVQHAHNSMIQSELYNTSMQQAASICHGALARASKSAALRKSQSNGDGR